MNICYKHGQLCLLTVAPRSSWCHVLGRGPLHSATYTSHTMTYEESVLNAADDAGLLTSKDAKRLLRDHGVSAADAWMDLGDSATDAAKLLEYLGY